MNEVDRKHLLRDFFKSILARWNLLIWLLSSFAAAVAGPFGTFEKMDFGYRSAFWVFVIAIGIVLGYVARFLAAWLSETTKPPFVDIVTVLFTVVIAGPVVWWVTMRMPYIDMTKVVTPLFYIFYVFFVSAGVIALRRLLIGPEGRTLFELRFEQIRGERLAISGAQIRPRLAERLERGLVSPILRLTVRDHHVEVVSMNESEMVRMRFGDAINEMEPVKGYCTHRSHWVTHDAIQGVLHEPGGKIYLHLHNGDKIPVSRKYRPDLENAGIV